MDDFQAPFPPALGAKGVSQNTAGLTPRRSTRAVMGEVAAGRVGEFQESYVADVEGFTRVCRREMPRRIVGIAHVTWTPSRTRISKRVREKSAQVRS